MSTATETREIAPCVTPWGYVQQATVIADGITLVSTASHGGFWLSRKRERSMPEPYRSKRRFAGGDWFEEDCDAVLVVLAFPEYFQPSQVEQARCMWDNYRKGQP